MFRNPYIFLRFLLSNYNIRNLTNLFFDNRFRKFIFPHSNFKKIIWEINWQNVSKNTPECIHQIVEFKVDNIIGKIKWPNAKL